MPDLNQQRADASAPPFPFVGEPKDRLYDEKYHVVWEIHPEPEIHRRYLIEKIWSS